MSYETILFEQGEDKVATVTINRPEAFNSFNQKMCLEFREVWERVRTDSSINAVVLRASPGRAFCPGVDVRNRGDGPGVLMYEDLFAQVDPGEYLGPKANKLWKPVITAIHGMAAGGAFYWINESDLVIFSEDATFFDPHVTYGMVAALEPIGATRVIPLQQVLRMTLLGNDERIGAETALRISLVTEVVKLENLWARAHELAAKIASKPSIATQGSVRAIWESLDVSRTAAMQRGMVYTQIGNATGTAQVDRNAVMATAKSFVVR
ncbi:MAG: enoyl-CoA hydratase [Phenylobacterium sp.]|nr:enoyl-CoA hydratase [Phenylobacterium sp.]